MKKKKIIYVSIFWIYMLFLLIVVIFRFLPYERFWVLRITCASMRKSGEINWTLNPFQTIKNFHSIGNICKNVLTFIPFGFYAFRFFHSSVIKTILASELFILTVQLIRFVALIGFFDTGDFIRYTAGIVIGMIFAKFYDSKISKIKLSDSMKN